MSVQTILTMNLWRLGGIFLGPKRADRFGSGCEDATKLTGR